MRYQRLSYAVSEIIICSRKVILFLLDSMFSLLFPLSAEGAKCYRCTSLDNDKCGVTWGYKSESSIPKNATVTCAGKGCKKIVSRDGPAGE